MGWFKLLTPFFAPIFDFVQKFAMGIFIYKAGKKDNELDNRKAEDKNVKKSKKIASGIDSMSDSELRDLLRAGRKKPKD